MNKVNELVVWRQGRESEEEFKRKLSNAIVTLLDCGYVCKVRADETDIIVIEYDHEDRNLGSAYPYWLTPSQLESVQTGGDEE